MTTKHSLGDIIAMADRVMHMVRSATTTSIMLWFRKILILMTIVTLSLMNTSCTNPKLPERMYPDLVVTATLEQDKTLRGFVCGFCACKPNLMELIRAGMADAFDLPDLEIRHAPEAGTA